MRTITFDFPTSNDERTFVEIENYGEILGCLEEIPNNLEYYDIGFDIIDDDRNSTETYSTLTPNKSDLHEFAIKIRNLLWEEK